NTGSRTSWQIDHVTPREHAEAGAFARPPVESHARFTAGTSTTVPFMFVGSSRSHIVVAAKVSGTDTHLLFDTRAPNYFSPEAARRLGRAAAGGLNLPGVGESSPAGGFATADRILIGSAELRDETVIVGPLPFPDSGARAGPEGCFGFE